MAKPAYRLLDHTADLGFEVDAKTRDDLFARAVLALADIVTPIEPLATSERRTIEREGDDDVSRLHALLDEALFLFETESFLPARASVQIDGRVVRAELHGEIVDPEKRPIERVVKAVTYHELAIVERDGALTARVILDL